MIPLHVALAWPPSLYFVVFEIECETSDRTFFGESGRSVEKRVKEHRSQAKNGLSELSAVAWHVCEGHCIKWNQKILVNATRTRKKKLRRPFPSMGKTSWGRLL